VNTRSPVDEADDRALFETQTVRDDERSRLQAAANQAAWLRNTSQLRQKRSEDSEFDNVDGLNVDEERFARVRTAKAAITSKTKHAIKLKSCKTCTTVAALVSI